MFAYLRRLARRLHYVLAKRSEFLGIPFAAKDVIELQEVTSAMKPTLREDVSSLLQPAKYLPSSVTLPLRAFPSRNALP